MRAASTSMVKPHHVHWLSLVAVLSTFVSFGHGLSENGQDCEQNIVAHRPVVISSNNGSEPRRCSYSIIVPPDTLPDHVFQVTLLAFSLGHRSPDGSTCEAGWARMGGSLYCGGPIKPGAFLMFPTSKHKSHLNIIINPPASPHDFQARVELLPRLTVQEKHPEMILATPGHVMPYSECDKVYHCLDYPGYCQLTSPGFPGLYPRPSNCSYHLKSPESGLIIGGRYEVFEVGNKIQGGIKQNCEGDDYVAIYDGNELISRFCGSGRRFPRIITRSSEIKIQFSAMTAGRPARGFVLSVERSPPHLAENSKCFQTFKVGSNVQQLKSPNHWLPPKSQCTYTLTTKKGDSIWLLFTTFKTKSNCTEFDDYVAVYDGNEMVANFCSHKSLISPLVSRSTQLKIVFVSPNGTLDSTSKLYFAARFTAVNINEVGQHIPKTWCDTTFSSHAGGPISFLNPRELILHVKNSTRMLTCNHHFIAPAGHTVRLQLDQTNFEPLYRCGSVVDHCLAPRFDKIVVTERNKNYVLGCECGARKHAQIFHSKGSEMIVSMTLNANHELFATALKYSPELYKFQGRYQFIAPKNNTLHCGDYLLTENSLVFPENPNLTLSSPILCYWHLKNINITSLNINKLHLHDDCKHNFLVVSHNSKEIILCSRDVMDNNKMWNDSDFNLTDVKLFLQISNKGYANLSITWENPTLHINQVTNDFGFDPRCYSVITLSLLMAGAAVCTMTLLLTFALIIWRSRSSVWTLWRRGEQRRYSSVTRHRTGTVW